MSGRYALQIAEVGLPSLTISHELVARDSFRHVAIKLRAVTLLFLLQVFVGLGLLSGGAAPFELISGHDPLLAPPSGGGGDSWGPILSPDGRYVLFASTANNLLLTSNNTALPLQGVAKLNVFLRNRTNGSTTLVSVNLNGVGGNGDSIPTGISTNGRYACFESTASDLVAGDTNGVRDIFVRDLVSNVTILVSANNNGGPGNGVCRRSTMTPDGRFVAFVSAATDLVNDDTNGIPDVFARDLQSGQTALVSVGAMNTNSYPACSSEAPVISADGRYVAFFSNATNLVPGVVNAGEIYVRDLVAGITIWASTNAGSLSGMSNAISYNHAISADGKFVAFQTSTNPLLSFSRRGVIFRYNLDTGSTDLVNTNAYSQAENPEDIRNLDMTPDGRFIAFVAGSNTTNAIYVWDAQSSSTVLASGDLSNAIPAGSICDWPSIDASGRFVAFLSSATNMVTNAIAGDYHLYLRDLQTATTALADADTNGVGASVGPMSAPSLHGDVRLIAFERLDGDLVANDRNHAYDLFLRDVQAGVTDLVSARHPALPSAAANGPSAGSVSVSGDGRYVAFGSDADNVVLGDTNGFRDIFVRDRFTGSIVQVSIGTNGSAADGISSEPSISANGQYVAFSSTADNLVAGDTNKAQDIFVRDLQLGTNILVSVATNGTAFGNLASYSPMISSDGRYVLFRSYAKNLISGTFNANENLFLRDLVSGRTYQLSSNVVYAASMTPDGRFVAFSEYFAGSIYVWDSQLAARISTNSIPQLPNLIGVSSDGTRIAYLGNGVVGAIDRVANQSWSIVSNVVGANSLGLRFTADGRFFVFAATTSGNTNRQIWLYDFDARTKGLISRSFDGTSGANADCDSPDITPDGRFVVFRSLATNLVSSPDSNGEPDIFLHDRLTGTMTLLSVNRFADKAGDRRSRTPRFSADSQTLFFQSWASDLVSLDFNQSQDVFVLALLYTSIAASSTPGQGPTLSWPARPDETYHVQFKQNLSDSEWQEVNGTVTVTGNRASLTDLAPGTGQRFYRVVTF
jgi:Tol biopolymer transport system component